MTLSLSLLVEGDGEVQALPVLVRRIVHNIDPSVSVVIPRPFRHASGSMRRSGGLERAINAVVEKQGNRAVLVLLDSDDDCPAKLGPEMSRRAHTARPDIAVPVVLASAEYEAWFLAAAESLAGACGLRQDLKAPSDPEGIRDCKGWLSARMVSRTGTYSATQDQASLSARLDLELARSRSRSFRKLWKELEFLLKG